jgi:hypothetical protein
MQAITFQAIPILIDGHDAQGQLVLFDEQLVAVLARLDGDAHDPAMKSWWNLEAGFGPCDAKGDNLFKTLDEAGAWVRQRIGERTSRASAQRLTVVK